MKRMTLRLLAVLTCAVLFAPHALPAFAAGIGDDAVLYCTATQTEGTQDVCVEVYLKENAGFNAATFTLKYDNNVFAFQGFERGTALSSMHLLSTNTETEEGYAITPFKFNFWSENVTNDRSTGLLLVLRFSVLPNAANGVYKITLAADKNKDITYVTANGLVMTKNAAIGGVRITVEENGITEIAQDTDEPLSPLAIVGIACGAALVIAASVIAVYKIRRRNKIKRQWVRL